MNIRCKLLLAISALLLSSAARADVVWPALYLETRLFSWWAIGLVLVVEYLFIRYVFAITPRKALIADVSANAASAVLGVLLIPLAGVAWEVFPGLAFYHLLNVGTFNPVTWAATFAMACLINAALESFVLKRAFGLPFTRRTFWWLVLANAFSVGIAFGSLWLHPVHM
ncbi:hypothetical protein [uncultured Thiothrix sp.]|uniref:hypothetical protein n=1 Tax=uncultured Thiothrix sp. TaxID=223185 RepID=UPI002623A745|nr:hypothetical protein [uncultured Thiothrix sp.]